MKWNNVYLLLNITTQNVVLVASPHIPHLSMIPIMTFTFELWPPKSIGFIMVNMSTKFDEKALNSLFCIGFTAISVLVYCDLDLWPPKSIGSILSPLLTFLQEIHNGLLSIVFTSLFPLMSIVTLTFDLWPPKSIGFILSPWLTCLPSLIKKHTTV